MSGLRAGGAQPLSASGSQAITGLNNLSLNQGFEFYTHCIETPALTVDINVANGSAVNTDPRSGQAALHPGMWRFRLENDANARIVMQESSANATRPLEFGGGTWILETLINFETLSTAADEYVAMWGFADARANDAISDGVYFEYDRTNSVNYIAVTEASGTRTEIDSGIAVSTTASTWVKLRIEINADASSVEFFVNSTSIGSSTTNIPASVDMNYFVRAIKSASTGSQNIFYMDYFYLRNQLTTVI